MNLLTLGLYAGLVCWWHRWFIISKARVDSKYGIAFGFAGFVITLAGMYYSTGMLDLRFPAVGAGLFGGGAMLCPNSPTASFVYPQNT